MSRKEIYHYLSDGVSFVSDSAFLSRKIYFPLCGISCAGIKSSITPYLSGDIKIDQDHFLTKPASREDLHQDVRNFFVSVEGKSVYSLTQETDSNSARIEAGPLWHKLIRSYPGVGLEMTALNFVPVTGENIELMRVTLKNTSSNDIQLTPTFSLPIFGRALANKHDHEHVTSLLTRIEQLPEGVLVKPTMLFDERNHEINGHVYFAFGAEDNAAPPQGSFPTLESFCGEAGTLQNPQAAARNQKPVQLPKELLNGKEACGALRFKEVILKAGEIKDYFVVMGAASTRDEARKIFKNFKSKEQFDEALQENKKFWLKKADSIKFKKKDAHFNAWVKWVTLQPVFRRIFGCSFLPDHDYGKGGRGWRDIWQDLLSLILIEPEEIRGDLINNFAGVRIDGSNATIIGSKPGDPIRLLPPRAGFAQGPEQAKRAEGFLADRNNITRVWMDHGLWPLATLLLYIHQTGDLDILFKSAPYFRDPQLSRTFENDLKWTPEYGRQLKTKSGRIYKGTILEHILVEHLTQFFNVGGHNIIRLEGADWNDGLDMAFERGESAAFMSFYGGNLFKLADLLEECTRQKKLKKINLAKELKILLDTLSTKKCNYNNVQEKQKLLFERYFKAVQPEISGDQIQIQIEDLAGDLRKKGKWIFDHIRRREKVSVQENSQAFSWFNGYYDNKGKRVEGKKDSSIWMTLTGQVFAIMSGLASDEEIEEVIKSVNRFLKDPEQGGIHLNTDFGLDYYPDLGRAFGFAYGTKENGSFFSHMSVMYAYALYSRGFVREGWEVLNNLYRMSASPRSRIYPGIPEYFDLEGRGMYHYLTGSASWFILTQLTQSFGVRGQYGDLILAPKLVKEEFNEEGAARVSFQFAGKRFLVEYVNLSHLDYGRYAIKEIRANHQPIAIERFSAAVIKIKREALRGLPEGTVILIELA